MKQIFYLFQNIKESLMRSNVLRKNHTSIYALASGHNQKCGVAVVRLSGKSTLDVLAKLTDKNRNSYKPRMMYVRNIWHPISKDKIDKCLVVWFKGKLIS